MAHYEVRKYPGWHHHMLTTMLAHFFSGTEAAIGEKSPSADGVTGADFIGSGLPVEVYNSGGPRVGAAAHQRVSCTPKAARDRR